MVVDLVVIVLVVIAAFGGRRDGLLVRAFGLVGWAAGAGLALLSAEPLAREFGLADASGSAPTFGILMIGLGGFLGNFAGVKLGARLRGHLRSTAVRRGDRALGSAFAIVTVLLLAWGVGRIAAFASIPDVTASVHRSRVLAAVNDVLPSSLVNGYDDLTKNLADGNAPRVFGAFSSESILPTEPPDQAVLALPQVQAAMTSVVRVTGTARACNASYEGSGFVYAPNRVMTNAHVVQGIKSPTVTVGTKQYPATVVLFDERQDVAVLAVPNLPVAALSFTPALARGDSAAVLGYPEDGPFDARAARIRARGTINTNDLDGNPVKRDVLTINALVRHGNSGGPLITTDGTVTGVVFAASTEDSSTGYALTSDDVEPDAMTGASATAAVSTGSCS